MTKGLRMNWAGMYKGTSRSRVWPENSATEGVGHEMRWENSREVLLRFQNPVWHVDFILKEAQRFTQENEMT